MTEFENRIKELRESIYQGNVSEGVTMLGMWLLDELEPEERAQVLLELILLSLVCGDLEEAQTRWDECRALNVSVDETRQKAFEAFFLLLSGKKKRGLSIFESCILECPDAFELYLLRGLGYAQMEQYDYAQAELDRANSLCPNNVLVMSTMGDVCVELGQVKRAVSLHEAVLEMCPDFRRSLMSLGVLYFDMERLEDAFRLFQCLVAYDPLNWFAWTCLGDIRCTQVGRTFQALHCYSAAIVAGTEIGQTWLNLSRGLFALGRYEQGIRVLRQFDSVKGHHWDRSEKYSVRYMDLIWDVLNDPSIWASASFHERVSRLNLDKDELSMRLFSILALLGTFTYSDDIRQIFMCHMTGFINLANYMMGCENRVIQPEEGLLLCILARIYIWNGLMFEARAILGLLERSDEPRMQDVTHLLWNEYYEHGIAESETGIRIGEFHEEVIRDPMSEQCFNQLKIGARISRGQMEKWRDALTEVMRPEKSELLESVCDFPWKSAVIELEKSCRGSAEEASRMVRAFYDGLHAWSVWNESEHDAKEDFWAGYGETGCDKRVLTVLRRVTSQDASSADGVTAEELEMKAWRRIFTALSERSKELKEEVLSEAFNDDVVQVCSEAVEVALSGYEPLPFSLDGSAFKKLLSLNQHEVRELTEDTAAGLFKSVVSRYEFVGDRAKTISDVPKGEKTESLLKFWEKLHGRSAFEGAKDVLSDKERGLSERVFGASRVDPILGMTGASNEKAFLLPKSDSVSERLLFETISVPSFPRSAGCLSQAVCANQITRTVLVEQFFNRAASAILTWQSSRNCEDLSVFFEDPSYRFHKFSSFGRTGRTFHFEVQNVTVSRHFGHHETALNSDREMTHGRKKKAGGQKRKVHRDPMLIHGVSELEESLISAERWRSRHSLEVISASNELGYCDHPFMKQIWTWSEVHADAIWKEVSGIEDKIRHMEKGGIYVAIWQVHELLKRYPYLSRLYLLLGKLYVMQEAPERAMSAIQSGLVWEEKLYSQTGWRPLHEDNGHESALEPVTAMTEFEEEMSVLWSERFVFQPRDEAMYHYGAMESGFGLRERYPVSVPGLIRRVVMNDHGGGFEFYSLFKKYLQTETSLREAYFSALCEPGIYSLRDYLRRVVIEMVNPESFPLRRELAEMLIELYPQENPGGLGRFYSDNLQPANALQYAAYAHFSENVNEDYDDCSQSSVTLGCILYDLGFMEESMRYLGRAVKVRNPSPMAYLTRGCALIEMRMFDEAISCLKEGQKLDPMSDRFYYNLSLAYVEQGRLDDAEAAIKSGISLSKYPVDLNLQLMRVYVKKDLFVDALALARYVASEDPEMFMNALRFSEFDEFRKLRAVEQLMEECGGMKE